MEQQGQERNHNSSESKLDYSFALSNPVFSDKVLKLAIFVDTVPEKENDGSIGDFNAYDLIMAIKRRKEPIIDSSKELIIKTLNVSSVILAAKSPFFLKLFSDSKKECNQEEITLTIYSSEEAAVKELIKYMYSSSIVIPDKPIELIEVLVAAEKFDVPSCMKDCCQLLLSVMSVDAIQPLLNAANNFIPKIWVPRYHEDIIRLSCHGMRMFLSHNGLQVKSEDDAFDLLKNWSQCNYADQGEQWRIIKHEMIRLIRLQHLTPQKVKEVLCALCESNHLDNSVLASMMDAVADKHPRHGRSYTSHPIAVMALELPLKECIVYLDLTKGECKKRKYLVSQKFMLGENTFFLSVGRVKHRRKGFTLGSYLWLDLDNESEDQIQIEFEFSVRQTQTPHQFISLFESGCVFQSAGTRRVGLDDMFFASWDSVMAEDSKFFINGTMHLRVTVALIRHDR